MPKVKRFGCRKDAKNPNWNTLNYKQTHIIWSKGRMTAGIAHSGYYNSNRYAVCCVWASVGEAWHSVLHLCIVPPESRNRQKQTIGNKAVSRPLVLCSSLQRLCKAKKGKGCGLHLLTRQHSTQYGVRKLWMINTQKAVRLTWEAEPWQGTFCEWCINLLTCLIRHTHARNIKSFQCCERILWRHNQNSPAVDALDVFATCVFLFPAYHQTFKL